MLRWLAILKLTQFDDHLDLQQRRVDPIGCLWERLLKRHLQPRVIYTNHQQSLRKIQFLLKSLVPRLVADKSQTPAWSTRMLDVQARYHAGGEQNANLWHCRSLELDQDRSF